MKITEVKTVLLTSPSTEDRVHESGVNAAGAWAQDRDPCLGRGRFADAEPALRLRVRPDSCERKVTMWMLKALSGQRFLQAIATSVLLASTAVAESG
ncbi:MAG: hypothetical protein ACREBC_24710, partial [Pyrinomonadaceae bacterium]